MTKSQYELIIIGAGVVGMGAALAAHKKGIKKILVIDRHQAVRELLLEILDLLL